MATRFRTIVLLCVLQLRFFEAFRFNEISRCGHCQRDAVSWSSRSLDAHRRHGRCFGSCSSALWTDFRECRQRATLGRGSLADWVCPVADAAVAFTLTSGRTPIAWQFLNFARGCLSVMYFEGYADFLLYNLHIF